MVDVAKLYVAKERESLDVKCFARPNEPDASTSKPVREGIICSFQRSTQSFIDNQ
jgi:hypothetical protein